MPWQNLDENKFLPLALLLIDSSGSREPAVQGMLNLPQHPSPSWLVHFHQIKGRKGDICRRSYI